TLALAYYLTDHEAYAQYAAKFVRAWFLDDATKMNPHLNYGQHIPGISEGRNVGIIESRSFFRIADAVRLLTGSKAWSVKDQQGFENWLKIYLFWLIESDLGKQEAEMENNHGTWYDVQVAYFALYVGETEIAKNILEKFPQKRITRQVEPDGRQPLELERTRAFSYSVMNLEGYFAAAQLGERIGLDIWNFSTEDGRSIRMALGFLIPYATNEKKWQHQQITSWEENCEHFMALLRLASIKYHDERYEHLIENLPGKEKKSSRVNLVFPKLEK
ncbi:MAG TPA: alginate lyase family protein, partial [bacterium]